MTRTVTFADRVNRAMQRRPLDEPSAHAILARMLLTYVDDADVTLRAGDVRAALDDARQAGAADVVAPPTSTSTRPTIATATAILILALARRALRPQA